MIFKLIFKDGRTEEEELLDPIPAIIYREGKTFTMKPRSGEPLREFHDASECDYVETDEADGAVNLDPRADESPATGRRYKVLHVTPELLVDLCKPGPDRILSVAKNPLPADAKLVGTGINAVWYDGRRAQIALVIESDTFEPTTIGSQLPTIEPPLILTTIVQRGPVSSRHDCTSTDRDECACGGVCKCHDGTPACAVCKTVGHPMIMLRGTAYCGSYVEDCIARTEAAGA